MQLFCRRSLLHPIGPDACSDDVLELVVLCRVHHGNHQSRIITPGGNCNRKVLRVEWHRTG